MNDPIQHRRARPATDEIRTAANELASQLAAVAFPLATPTTPHAEAARDGAVAQFRDHVLPRLANLDAPALVVVGGSTGSGKSTLVNSLLRAHVTVPGVLRPTTRAPVLVCHPESARWFEDQRILPGLSRITADGPLDPAAQSHSTVQLATNRALATTIALLDAPDVDSVVSENRELATKLLAAADLWIFVTTASRYADAVPWEHLRTAAARGVALVIVLNRVPPGAGPQIAEHLQQMLQAERLGDTHIFVVDEQPLTDGMLPEESMRVLREWMHALAADSAARDVLVLQTLTGVLRELVVRTDQVATALDEQVASAAALQTAADDAYELAASQIASDVRDGTVLRGEVLARWQDVIGTGELLRQLQSTLGRWRDRAVSAVTGKPRASDRFTGAIESGVETLILARAAEAAERVVGMWNASPAGASVLSNSPVDLVRTSPELPERAARMVRDWQGGLLDLLRTEGASKRTTARVMSYGVNGVALVLMVGVFSQTGGLSGAEVAIAGGTSAVGTKLMEAILGDQAVRKMTDAARRDLDDRVRGLLDLERQRFVDAIGAAGIPQQGGHDLRAAAGRLEASVRDGVAGANLEAQHSVEQVPEP